MTEEYRKFLERRKEKPSEAHGHLEHDDISSGKTQDRLKPDDGQNSEVQDSLKPDDGQHSDVQDRVEHGDIPHWKPASQLEQDNSLHWKPPERKEDTAPVEEANAEILEHNDAMRWKPQGQEEDTKPDAEETSDILEHHGIRGMRWYHRRFQDKNGRLTPEGKIRYGKGSNDSGDKKESTGKSDAEKKTSSSDGESKPKKYNSKTLTYKAKAQNLSEDELDARIRRMQKEAQYNQLRSQLQPKTKSQKRKELVNKLFVATASTAAAAIMTKLYTEAAAFIIKKASKGRIDLSPKKKEKK